MHLNSHQKRSLWLGIALLLSVGFYPPWKVDDGRPVEFAPIFQPPHIEGHSIALDYGRLAVMWIMAFVVTFGLVVSHQTKAEAPQKEKESAIEEEQAEEEEPAPPKAKRKKSGLALTFPERSVGSLLIESDEDEEYLDLFHEARGRVPVEPGMRLELEFEKDERADLAFLSSVGNKESRSTIYSVDLSGCQLEDDDLKHLKLLPGLEELDLTGTPITDGGLVYLKDLSRLTKLWLDGTAVTGQAFESLSGLNGLTKLSVSESLVLDIKSIEEKLPACKVVFDEGNS